MFGDVQCGVWAADRAGRLPVDGEEAAGAVPVDLPSSAAGHAAVADVHGQRVPCGAVEFEDPVWYWPAVLLFGLTLFQFGGLAVDAGQPHGMPGPHSEESGSSSAAAAL
jgi:hypothetical protein